MSKTELFNEYDHVKCWGTGRINKIKGVYVHINVDIPPKMKQGIKQVMKQRCETQSDFVRRAIERELSLYGS